MKHQKLLILVLVALFALGSVTTALAQDKSLIYWDTMNNNERPVMQDIITSCESEVGVTVDYQYVPFSDAQNKYKTAAQAGDAPDILRTEIAWGPEFAALGYLLDISDSSLVSEPVTQEERESYIAAAFDYNTWGGKIWGLPQVTDAPALLYNKALFEKAGLDPDNPPTTMDELKEAAKQISALGADTYGIATLAGSYFFQPFMWAFGGGLIDPADLSIHINDAGTIDALNFITGLIADGEMGPAYDPANQYGNNQTAFKEGKAGMLINGPWASSDILSGPEFVDNPDNLGVAAIPEGPAGQGSPVGGHEYTIYAGTPFPNEALAMVRCLNKPENQATLADELNLVPTVLEAYEDSSLSENMLLQGFLAQMKVATNRPVIPAGGAIYDAFGASYDKVILGEIEPQAGMDAVADAWQLLLDASPQ